MAASISTGSLLLLAALTAVAPISVDIYLPSMPSMAREFAVGQAEIQFSLSVFFFGLALGQLMHGPLSDILGRKPVLIGGFTLYLLTSVLCAVTDSIEIMLLGRFLQALGGSAGVVLSRAIIRDQLEGAPAARAFSLIMSIMLIGPIIAPTLGGYILLWAGWRAIFWAMVLLGAVGLLAAIFILEESHAPEHRQPFALRRMLANYRQALSHQKIFGYLACEAATSIGMFSYIITAPFVFIEYLGISPQAFGIVFALNAAGLAAGAAINSYWVTRAGVQTLLCVGIAVMLAGAGLVFAVALAGIQDLRLIILALMINFSPMIMVRANLMASGMQYFPRISGTVSALFGAIGLGAGGLAGGLVGTAESGGMIPMAATMLSGAAACAGIYWFTAQLKDRAA